MENVRELLKEPPPHIKGKVVNHHVFLDITEDVVHYWSPQLNFRIEADDQIEMLKQFVRDAINIKD